MFKNETLVTWLEQSPDGPDLEDNTELLYRMLVAILEVVEPAMDDTALEAMEAAEREFVKFRDGVGRE